MLLGRHYNLLLLVGHDHRVAIQHCNKRDLEQPSRGATLDVLHTTMHTLNMDHREAS